jgi:DNA-directed RNA polymerase specialized sigma24 family protein
MEGWTNVEIAGHLDCTTRTVERKLELIRTHWQENGNAVGSDEE